MIYLVSKNVNLFKTDEYSEITLDEALQLLNPLKEVQCDTETSKLDCHTGQLLTLQLGCAENQIVFDWTTLSSNERFKIKEFMESNRLFIFHNAQFDLTWLYKNNIWPKKIYDTMIAEQLIYLGYPRSITDELMSEIGGPLDGYKRVFNKNTNTYYWELSYSLKATAERRINVDIDKSVRGQIITDGLTIAVIKYAGGDVQYLEAIKEKQLEELEKQNLVKAVEFECAFIKGLAYEKYCGIKLDVAKWEAKMKQDLENLKNAEKELNDYVISLDKKEYIYRYTDSEKEVKKALALKFVPAPEKGENWYKYRIKGKFTKVDLQGDLFMGFNTEPQCTINWSSSTQVIALFEILGIQTHTFDKKTKKEKKSVEEKQIAPQAKDFPIIPIFLRYQEYAKVVSTYGENWLKAVNEKTGRIHAELHSIGTDTGRISSGGGTYKVNILNLPRDAKTRECFVAEKGNKWISADYEGQESAITASTSGDERMMSIINNGEDMHSIVAKLCWPDIIGDTPINEIKSKFKNIRQEAKGCEFGIFYGGDFNTLHANKGIPLDQAKEIYDNFMEGFPGIKKYQDECREVVMRDGYILLNPITKHRAHIFDFPFLKRMEEKFSEPDFWEYYRNMKFCAPGCDTVRDVKKYFKRKAESGRQSINYRIKLGSV